MTNNLQATPLDIKNFGDNLWRIREEKKITRQQLADAIGLSDQRIIYDYENGVKRPMLERALQISVVLGVTLDSMFR